MTWLVADRYISLAIIDPKGLEKSMMESIATASKSFCCIVFVSLVLNCFDDFRSDAKLLPREEGMEKFLQSNSFDIVLSMIIASMVCWQVEICSSCRSFCATTDDKCQLGVTKCYK